VNRSGVAQPSATHDQIDGLRAAAHAMNWAANAASVLSAPRGKRWPHVLRTLGIAAALELVALGVKSIVPNR